MALRLNVTQFLLGSQRGRIKKLGLIDNDKPEFLVLETGISCYSQSTFLSIFFCFAHRFGQSLKTTKSIVVFPCHCMAVAPVRFRSFCFLIIKKSKASLLGLPYFLVLETGIEPVRCCHRGILSPLRLPVPPLQHNLCRKFFT